MKASIKNLSYQTTIITALSFSGLLICFTTGCRSTSKKSSVALEARPVWEHQILEQKIKPHKEQAKHDMRAMQNKLQQEGWSVGSFLTITNQAHGHKYRRWDISRGQK